MHSICSENKNPVRISYEYGTFRLDGNPHIYLGAKQKKNEQNSEEFPNDIKNPYNQWETPLGVLFL